ncbi:Dor1-like family-domain-containing protein [Chlamydoabsidia padenii]|nr:Dor1-like family-domain-containing protein [Chlamydoabsidia padenii]
MSIAATSPPVDDNTSLLQLLTEDWDESKRLLLQNSSRTSDYLNRLMSSSLDELVREPMTIRTNQAQIKRETQQLTYTDYSAFLHAESCRRALGTTLDSLDDQCNDLLNMTTPALQQACETFLDEAKTIVLERNKMTKVLEHQHVLTDLLELPQLMDTCVWNGYYSEAMDLAAHVRLLQVRYPHLPVIDTIQSQVQASSDLMLIQLISHLRQPIKLAAAMNVIGCLRRMDVFGSERELRMVFLRCRHNCMQQRLEKIKKPMEDTVSNSQDTFDYLKRYVDIMREQMFEMATHYMSVFSNKETDTLLPDYMTQLVMQIQQTLKDHLSFIDDTSALASLLTQLQYCGMSLGRVGLDFRSLFVQSFEQAVLPLVVRTMDQATGLLSIDTLQASIQDQILPSTWLNNCNNNAISSTPTTNPYQPPALLVDYPCLAVFTNGILTALNALRLLPAIHLFSTVKQQLDTCLLNIATVMKQYGDQSRDVNQEEVSLVESFANAYARCCVPFLQRCLVEGIFGYPVENDVTADVENILKDYLVSANERVEQDQDSTRDNATSDNDTKTEIVTDIPSGDSAPMTHQVDHGDDNHVDQSLDTTATSSDTQVDQPDDDQMVDSTETTTTTTNDDDDDDDQVDLPNGDQVNQTADDPLIQSSIKKSQDTQGDPIPIDNKVPTEKQE